MKRLYIPILGAILVRLSLLRGEHEYDQRFSKVPYWKRNTTTLQQFKINLRVAYRRFDTQTKGMGLMLLIIISGMAVIQLLGNLGWWVSEYLKDNSYKTALTKFCTDKQFYTYNFQSCENRGVRPLQ